MSRKITDQEIASLQAEGFGRYESTRGRLMSALELLLRFSDENEGVTAREAARVLAACGNTKPTENTLRDDLCALAETSPFGIRIETPKKGDNRGYRVVERLVKPNEAVLLLDMIRTCKFIPLDQKTELEQKIQKLIPDSKQNEIIDTIILSERENDSTSNVLTVLNTASRAIRDYKQLSFSYMTHRMDNSYVETDLRTEDPISLLYSFGHYYLETITASVENPDGNLQFRRLDHIRRITIPGTEVADKKRIDRLRKAAPALLGELVDMRGDGISRTLFLRVEGKFAGYVYDRFGHNLRFAHIKESQDKVVGYAHVRIQLSETFFRWLFGMRGGVKLEKPKSIRWVRSFSALQNIQPNTFQQLTRDYEIAIDQYSNLLQKAIDTL